MSLLRLSMDVQKKRGFVVVLLLFSLFIISHFFLSSAGITGAAVSVISDDIVISLEAGNELKVLPEEIELPVESAMENVSDNFSDRNPELDEAASNEDVNTSPNSIVNLSLPEVNDLPAKENEESYPLAEGMTLNDTSLQVEDSSSNNTGLLFPAGISPASFITSAQADGLVGYSELNIQTPRYRLWNESNNFTTEQTDAQTAGADINWIVVRANHERDEVIMGTEDQTNDVNIQIYNSSRQWGNLLEVSTEVLNSNSRAFDIAIEDVSGDVLIVYENNSLADTVIPYRIWNGTGYSSLQTLVTGLPSSPIRWVQLDSRRGSDDIMLMIHNDAGDLHAFHWNGTEFGTTTSNLTLSLATVTNTNEHFYFAWEGTTDQGLAAYGEGTNLVYRTFSITAPNWGAANTLDLADSLAEVRLCADPSSEYIGILVQDGGNDVNVRMWDGSSFLAGSPAQDGAVEPAGTNNANVDCAWYNASTALFGFVDSNLLSVDYFNFTKPNSWGISDLTTAPTTTAFASDDIEGLRFTKHPSTSEIMLVAADIAEDISLFRWDGSVFSSIGESPLETTTEVLNGAQESVMFDWYRYDPVPNVTLIGPTALFNFNTSTIININATVIDTVGVSQVLANITLPNSSVVQITLNNTISSTFFNNTFGITTLNGTYIVKIIANDTGPHHNVNASENITFTIGDVILPNVTGLRPVAGTIFEIYDSVNISANVTDSFLNVTVSVVLANITAPNGSIFQIALLNQSVSLYNPILFNGTFPNTGSLGLYTVRIIANDTSNNVNNSEITTFSVTDMTKPVVTTLTPTPGTNITMGTGVNITTNVTDNVAVSMIFVNVTLPDGSTQQISLSDNDNNNVYNVTFSSTIVSGLYQVQFVANDTSNNINNTERTNFTVINSDITPPNVTNLIPVLNSRFNSSTSIEIAVNVIDNQTSASVVLANVTLLSNLSTYTLTLTNGTSYNTKFNISYTIPNSTGVYNITFFANDTNNNINNTERTNFTVILPDVTPPNVTTLLPFLNTVFNHSQSIEIAANVLDNQSGISAVFANVTLLSNSSTYTLVLTNGTGYNTKFNISYTIPNSTGVYNITFFANDTGNNINNTERTNFTVILPDVTPPNVTSLIPAPDTVFSHSKNIEIAANVFDNQSGISLVFANITLLSNLSTYTVLLTNGTGYNTKFNGSYFIPNSTGVYTVIFFANDTSNNINNTERTNFTVILPDVTAPNVTSLIPTLNTVFNNSTTIEIAATVLDNQTSVSVVLANITLLSNGSTYTLTLTNSTGANAKFNSSYHIPNATGVYNVTFFANDTGNNINNTERTNFTVQDISAPSVTALRPVNGSLARVGETVEIAANVTNSVAVDTVLINLTFPNSSVSQFKLESAIGSKYNLSFIIPGNSGLYTIVFIANDTNNNINSTERTNFSTDSDDDGVADQADTLRGNESDVTTSGVSSLNITVNGNSSQGSFAGIQEVAFYDNNKILVNFTHNFSNSTIELNQINLTVTAAGIILNMHGQLGPNETKTLILDDNNFVSLCVKDMPLLSIGDISADCNQDNETKFDSCLGVSTGTTLNGLTCYDEGSRIRIADLRHSGIIGTIAGAAVSGSGGGVSTSPAAASPPAGGPAPAEQIGGVTEVAPALFDVLISTAPGFEEISVHESELRVLVQLLKFGALNKSATVNLHYRIYGEEGNIVQEQETREVETDISFLKTFFLPQLRPGVYTIELKIDYDDKFAASTATFSVEEQIPSLQERRFQQFKKYSPYVFAGLMLAVITFLVFRYIRRKGSTGIASDTGIERYARKKRPKTASTIKKVPPLAEKAELAKASPTVLYGVLIRIARGFKTIPVDDPAVKVLVELLQLGSSNKSIPIHFYYHISGEDGTVREEREVREIGTDISLQKTFSFPSLQPGVYTIKLRIEYEGQSAKSKTTFSVKEKRVRKNE